MKIALINPNSTAAMTEKCRVVAENYKFQGTEVWASNPTDTPESIEGQYDEAVSVAGLLKDTNKAIEWGADGLVVACFDDPGIGACRELMDGPVVGICEGAMKSASLIAKNFSVVTTLPRAVPLIEELAHRYGMERYCRKVRAADIPVLELERSPEEAYAKIEAEILKAREQDDCESVILGCAGMADLTIRLSQSCGLPVIDGVLATFKLVESLVGAKLQTSKIGAYAKPRFEK